jgi:hypothetical protein
MAGEVHLESAKDNEPCGEGLAQHAQGTAEFETNLRCERQLEGIAKAKAEGCLQGTKAVYKPRSDRLPSKGGSGGHRNCEETEDWQSVSVPFAHDLMSILCPVLLLSHHEHEEWKSVLGYGGRRPQATLAPTSTRSAQG